MKMSARGFRLTTSYFRTYFIILLVPIVMSFFFYRESTQIVQTDIENENHTLLCQASEILDVRLQELNQIGTQIVNNSQVTSLRYVDSPLEYPNIQYYFQVQNTLPDYASFNDFLCDYVLFFNHGQLALSSGDAYSYSDYYDLYMHPNGQAKEEWIKSLMDAPISFGRCQNVDMLYLRNDSPVSKQLITFSYSFLPFNNGDGQVVLYVDQANLMEMLDAFGLIQGDIAFIQTQDGQMLAANTQDEQAVKALCELLQGSEDSSSDLTHQVNGQEMLISSYRSSQTGFQITIARNTQKLFARLHNLRNIIIVSLLCVLALGTLICYFFSRRNSRLLRDLASSSNGSLSQMSYAEAFRSLRQTFEDIKSSNDSLSTTLAQQRPYLLQSFLSQLLDGIFGNEEDARATAKSIHALSESAPMCVVLFHFAKGASAADTLERKNTANCKAIIRLSIEAREKDALYMERSDDDFALLLAGDKLESRINELVALVRSNLPQNINEILFVYVGNTVEKLTDVVRSWDNASSMIYIRPSPAEAPVLTYMAGESAKAGIFYPQDIQRRLVNGVMNADEKEVDKLLELLQERNLQEKNQPGYIRLLFTDSLLNTLLHISAMADLPPEKKDDVQQQIHDLMSLPVEQRMTEIRSIFLSLCRLVQQAKSSKPQMMDEVMAYLKEHYMDADLSLTLVADHFHISESYLSYTFKATSGVNFFTCVETMRMDKAKEMLRSTDAKISDIAAQIGYASDNSFCRAFKRNTGSSATAYRNGMD